MVAVTERALSRGPAPPTTFGLGWCDSRVMVELLKDGKESLFVIWVPPSPPDRGFLGSLLLGAAGSAVAPLALAEEVSLMVAEASRTPGLASGKLQEELRDFSGRAVDRKELCPLAEGDRFMPLGLPASVGGFWGLSPFPLASGKPFPTTPGGLSVPFSLASPCARDRLASSFRLSVGT